MTRLITMLFAIVLTISNASGRPGDCTTPSPRVNGQIIVHPAVGAEIADFLDALSQANPDLAPTVLDQIPGRPLYLIELGAPGTWTEQQFEALELQLETNYQSTLLWGEFEYLDETPEGTTGSTLVDGIATTNDYQDQFAFDQVGAAVAQVGSQGAGVVVAVLDTGLDLDHPAFVGRIAAGGFDFVENDSTPEDEAPGLDQDGDGLFDEMAGHGTFVSGLITLVAPDARILPIRVLNADGVGSLWNLARGVYYATDRGVEVINISIASTYKSEAVEMALDEAEMHGITVVAAAGNCGSTLDDSNYRQHPAQTSGAIAVTATDDNDVKGDFSNYGDDIVLSAPGTLAYQGQDPDPMRSIISTAPDGDYAYWAGTSMAVPLVSGAAALVRAQYPHWTPTESTAINVRTILELTATPIDAMNPPYEEMLGAGRLDAGAAVNAGPPAPPHGDLNADGGIDILDLLILIGDWSLTHSSADLDGDGTVGVLDLLVLLGRWS